MKITRFFLAAAMACALCVPAVARQNGQQRQSLRNGAQRLETVTQTAEEHRYVTPKGQVRQVMASFGRGITSPVAPQLPSFKAKQAKPVTVPKKVSSNLKVYGTTIYDKTWTTSTAAYGVYQLPVTADGAFDKLKGFNSAPLQCAFDGDHTLYCIYTYGYGDYVFGYDVKVYDTETWSLLKTIEGGMTLSAYAIDVDRTTGKFYGYFSGTDDNGQQMRYWGWTDFYSGVSYRIADMSISFRGVAIDKKGQAYGIDFGGNLYKVVKETGEMTLVGATGCPELTYMSGAAFNDKDGSIILSFCNDAASGLAEIDPATAACTVISTFANDEEVVGIYIPYQAPDAAPGKPSLTVANDGTQDVTFTITMPSVAYDGTPLADGTTLTYEVTAAGATVLSGTAAAGAEVIETKTVEQTGDVTFAVTASNEYGESEAAKASVFVGKGSPAAPTGVTLVWNDGTFTLTWDAVTTATDNGFFDPSAVTYTVTGNDGEVLAENLTATEWTAAQALPSELQSFRFNVAAVHFGKQSKAVASNPVTLGTMSTPLAMDLCVADNFPLHTVVDANNDNTTWYFDSAKNGVTYKYSKSNKADDWLITPAISLEAGKAYDFMAKARAYSDRYPETLEIYMGTAPTAEAMTLCVVPETELAGDLKELTGALVPETTGNWYVGFHVTTKAYQWNAYLTEYSVSEAYGAAAPDAVTSLKVVPNVTGALDAKVEFTTNSLTVTGQPYEGDMTVKVMRGDETIATRTVAAGTAVSVPDAVTEAGYYTYTVVCEDPSGNAGRKASVKGFIGPNVPNPPAVVHALENPAAYGEVTLTWESPLTDIDGNELLPSNLTYNVYVYNYATEKLERQNASPITECTYTFRALAEDAPQDFVQMFVQTVNAGVPGTGLASPGLVALGKPYELPMAISKVADFGSYIVGIDDSEGCTWGMTADDKFSVNSQDGDGEFFYGERLGSGLRSGDLIFGKVNLAGTKNPVLSLYNYKITDEDKNTLDVIVRCEGNETTVKTLDYTADATAVWTKKTVNLNAFAGKEVQLVLRYNSDGLVYYFMDNLKLMELPDHDLNAVDITGPKKAVAGEPFTIAVTVENTGFLPAGNFTVDLYANGIPVDSKSVESLAPDAVLTLDFEQSINMAAEKTVEYTAVIEYADDDDLSNNTTSKSVKVTREDSLLPTVANLTGTRTDAGHALSWDAIVQSELPADPVKEGFEEGEAFAKEYAGWTFVDRDQRPAGGFNEIEIPGHTQGVDKESFIVIDGDYSTLANSAYAKDFKASEGKQYLGCIYACGDVENSVATSDDWAISPLLNGREQTVKFMARNYSINYMEYMQVWYTTADSTDPADFVQLTSFNNTGATFRLVYVDKWTEFTFDLPAGAKRFAFRCVSNDGFMLMIDNVEYTPEGAETGLQHIGYNLYHNAVKLNDVPLETNSYTHAVVDYSQVNTYHVTALYNRGESEVSEPHTTEVSALGNVDGKKLSITATGGEIVVSGAGDKAVKIHSVDGRTVCAAFGDLRVAPGHGIYIVTVGETTVKVIVR